MGKPYDHQYHYGLGGSTGIMQCASCGKGINSREGAYRSYKRSKNGDWGFVNHHRECCADDPKWAELDAKRQASRVRESDFEKAFDAFRKQWPEVEEMLDDGEGW